MSHCAHLPDYRPAVEAGRAIPFPFVRPWSRATQAGRWVCALGDAAGPEGNAEGALKGGAADRFFGCGSPNTAPALGGEEQSRMAMGFPLLAQ